MTEYLESKIKNYVEQEEFDKAKALMEIASKERDLVLKEKELELKEKELAIKNNEIAGNVGVATINAAIGASQLLVDIISLAVHGRWIKMGFGFEATGSISSKTMNKIFLSGKI